MRLAVLALAVVTSAMASASAQTVKAPPKAAPSGIQICRVGLELSCTPRGCATRKAKAGLAIRINFGLQRACLQRHGRCGRVRSFVYFGKRKGAYTLYVYSISTTIVVTPNGMLRLFGPGETSITGMFAKCAPA